MVWNKGLTKEDPRVAKYTNKGKKYQKGQRNHPNWYKAFNEGRIGFKKGYIPYNKGLPPEKQPGYKGGRQKTGNGYIQLLMPEHPFADKRGRIMEHRYIMEQHLGRYLEKYEYLDHINGVRDDNRLENLRLCTRSQNQANRGKQINNTTGYKNITFSKAENKYIVQIGFENKIYSIGGYKNIEDALKARNDALKKIHKEFAKLD